jgi:hypothetical protein
MMDEDGYQYNMKIVFEFNQSTYQAKFEAQFPDAPIFSATGSDLTNAWIMLIREGQLQHHREQTHHNTKLL